MTNMLSRLDIAHNRAQGLTDSLQDALHVAQAAPLPPYYCNDLKRAVQFTESIFYMLANLRRHLQHSRADHKL